MADIVSPLLEWLNANPQWAGAATFAISAAESVAIIGTIVPGSITMTAIGALAGAGVIPLWATLFWAILGAIVGDGISYWIGHAFKDRLRMMWPFRNNPNILKQGEVFVHKYGIMSVFIGRFVGPVRALVPLVAGMLGMKPLQFTISNVASAIGWAPAYMLPGILLGAASLELPPDIALHVILVLLLITLFTLLCLWLIYKIFQLIHFQTSQLQNWIWHKLKENRIFSPIVFLLKSHDTNKTHGQLALAFFLIVTISLFFILAFYVKSVGPASITVNDAMYHLFRGISIRGEQLDNIMINFTLLGQKQVILPAVLVLVGWLMIFKRWRAAFHALALGILAAGSVFIFKNLIQSPRPWGIIQNSETFSMPSGHSTLAATVYIGLAFLIARSFRPSRRWPIYTCALFIILLVGISRLYLGAHWFTDVIGAWLLSASVLILVIISYQRHSEKPINPFGVLIVSLAALCLTFGYYHHTHIDTLRNAYKQISWPTEEIKLQQWWQKNHLIPADRVSLFGFQSQQLNIEWVGELEHIKNTLLKEGWVKPPARDWISTLHRIADIGSTEYLPMISPQYLDKRPALILIRRMNSQTVLVIRLWNAHRIIQETQKTLWVGTVGVVPRSYSWLFKRGSHKEEIDAALIFPMKATSSEWEWKTIMMNSSDASNRSTQQKIILIRENKPLHSKK